MKKMDRKQLYIGLSLLVLAGITLILAILTEEQRSSYFAAWAGASLGHGMYRLWRYLRQNDDAMQEMAKRRHIDAVDERMVMLRQLSGFQPNTAMCLLLTGMVCVSSFLWMMEICEPYAKCIMIVSSMLIIAQMIMGKIAYAKNEARY